MIRVVLALLATAAANAAVEGTVINRTTGKPQPGAEVTVFRLDESGMAPAGSVKSGAEGKFRLEQTLQGSVLIQTSYGGVTYSQMLSAGVPAGGLTVDVFDVSAQPGGAKVSQNMVLLEPGESELLVTENVIFQNEGKLTYHDPVSGTLRVFVPEAAAGKIRVMATAPGGLPLQRTAEKTGERNVYKIDFPVKPGETRVEISYAVPFSPPGRFSGMIIQKDTPVRLVAPQGVTLKGDGVELLGQEPHLQAAIYGVAGRKFTVEIQGTGTLRAAQDAAEADAGPSFEQILPRIYSRVYWIIGFGLAILMLGFILLYQARAAAPAPHSGSKSKRLR